MQSECQKNTGKQEQLTKQNSVAALGWPLISRANFRVMPVFPVFQNMSHWYLHIHTYSTFHLHILNQLLCRQSASPARSVWELICHIAKGRCRTVSDESDATHSTGLSQNVQRCQRCPLNIQKRQ